MLIYSITNKLNGKMYIGQTTKSLEQRIKNHKNAMVSGKDTHIYRAMRKYGWENFEFCVIAYAESQEVLDELEEYYIHKYDTVRSGYNMSYGGSVNIMYSEVVAEKHNNKMRTDEVRAKISNSMKKSYEDRGGISDEHRKHLSENKKAFYASERGKLAAKRFSETFKLSEAHKTALTKSLYKPVYCVAMDGTVVAEFNCVKDAALWWYEHGYIVKNPRNLSDRIKLSAKTDRFIRGLKWIYRV